MPGGGAITTEEAMMKRFMHIVAVGLWFVVASGYAAQGGGGAMYGGSDPVLQTASEAIEKKDWNAARTALKEGIAKSPDNADYHNLYAFALRKGESPDMKLVFKHYNEALRLNPKHKGAHEYIGEAYLMVGDVAKAKEHLAKLDDICFFKCEEYTELKEAIEAHENKKAQK
jgi:tetratricopeptide (TPR) repeat protein